VHTSSRADCHHTRWSTEGRGLILDKSHISPNFRKEEPITTVGVAASSYECCSTV
jgi:hypothetical protein